MNRPAFIAAMALLIIGVLAYVFRAKLGLVPANGVLRSGTNGLPLLPAGIKPGMWIRGDDMVVYGVQSDNKKKHWPCATSDANMAWSKSVKFPQSVVDSVQTASGYGEGQC